MRTCEAYAGHGFRVTLATLRVRRPDAIPTANLWQHFGVEPRFRVTVLPTRLEHDSSVTSFRLWAGGVASLLAVQWSARAILIGSPIVHTRTPVLLAPFVALRAFTPRSRRPRLILETHALPTGSNAWILRRADLVVTNSERLASDVASCFNLPEDRILHAPLPPFNAVLAQPKEVARQSLGLPTDRTIACYTGKLTPDHSDFLLRTAAEARSRVPRFTLMLVGGNPRILDWTKRRATELGVAGAVSIVGFVPPSDVARYQAAADVLLYHMPENVGIFPYTTPAKAFEYQTMRRPIVATDFPLFHEVFGEDGERAIRVVDRTPRGFANGISDALKTGDRPGMIERAAAFVADRTWDNRAAAILAAIGA